MYWRLLQLLREALQQSVYWHSHDVDHYEHAYVARRQREARESVDRTFEVVREWLAEDKSKVN